MIMSVHFMGIVSLQEYLRNSCPWRLLFSRALSGSLTCLLRAGWTWPSRSFAGDKPLFLTRESGSFIGAHFKCSILFWDVIQQFLSSGLLLRSGCRVLLNPIRFQTARIVANIGNPAGPVDRFFDLSVGSDFPGTLIRDDSQAQLKLVVDELGFRYIRFHAIFHDVLGTVRIENGKTLL